MNIFNKTTYETLKKNKTRTVVTIIGVMLSVAMVTAVTLLISSFQNFLLRMEIDDNGDWQSCISSTTNEGYETIAKDDRTQKYGAVCELGFSPLQFTSEEEKHFMYLRAFDDSSFKLKNIKVTEGKLPENDGEIILSKLIKNEKDCNYKIGDTITIDIGDRMIEGYKLGLDNPYLDAEALQDEEDSVENEVESNSTDINHESNSMEVQTEEFKVREQKQYKIVGFVEYRFYDRNEAGAYLAYTLCNDNALKDTDVTIYLTAKKPKDIYDLSKSIKSKNIDYNSEVLRYYGVYENENYTTTFLGLEAILIGLIMIGAVTLIFNAFSISVSERKKQFGLLASIGATKKQIANTVLFEAMYISSIGIPLGLITGTAGIGLTIKFVGNIISTFSVNNIAELRLYVTPAPIIASTILGLVIVLISAYIPSIRASKVSVVEAIRQTNDIKITGKKVKTSKLTMLLFGLEGDLATKNFKRNRKKYRSTVFSLFISIVLFVGASSFSNYLTMSSKDVLISSGYDLVCYEAVNSYEEMMKDYEKMCKAEGIEKSAIIFYRYLECKVNKENVYDAHYNDENAQKIYGEDALCEDVNFLFMPDEQFDSYVKEKGLSKDDYYDVNSPRAITFDVVKGFNKETERYEKWHLLKGDNVTVSAGHQITEYNYEEQGIDTSKNVDVTLEVHDIEDIPLGADNYLGWQIVAVMPYSMSEKALAGAFGEDRIKASDIYFTAEDSYTTSDNIYKIMSDKWDRNVINNKRQDEEEARKLILIVDLFAYGFIVLIALITIANVFNTISTNVSLRRREFAMLKSVGMTSHSFNKMMNFECLLYGIKALMYGLPASAGIAYLIYKSLSSSLDTTYRLPITSMLISTVCVFAVVFITMLYSMSKIKKQNIIETLKNDNI